MTDLIATGAAVVLMLALVGVAIRSAFRAGWFDDERPRRRRP